MYKWTNNSKISCFQNPCHRDPCFVVATIVTNATVGENNSHLENQNYDVNCFETEILHKNTPKDVRDSGAEETYESYVGQVLVIVMVETTPCFERNFCEETES